MNKVIFLNDIDYLKNEGAKNISTLATSLSNLSSVYSEDIDFSIESSKRNIYILLKKDEHELNIDLINDFLNIRFSYVELNFFINEIENNVLEKIFKDILIGNYTLYYSILENEKVGNVELIWKDSILCNFNSKDIYKKTIGDKLKVIEGYNWSK